MHLRVTNCILVALVYNARPFNFFERVGYARQGLGGTC